MLRTQDRVHTERQARYYRRRTTIELTGCHRNRIQCYLSHPDDSTPALPPVLPLG